MSNFVSIQDIEILQQLQSKILDYNNDSHELANFVLSSVYSQTSEGLALIIHEIFTASMCNIEFDYHLVDALKEIFEKSKIPIKELILEEVMSPQPICVKKQYLFILKQLLKQKLYTVSDIEDFSANYRHCSREELLMVFYTFAPELCEAKSDVYQIYYEKFIHRLMVNAFDVILVDFDKFAENNWSLMEKMLYQHIEEDSIQHALSKDDLDSLLTFASQPGFNIDKQIFYSIFSPHEMLSSATPIEIAAFFGSTKCFKYLLVNGAAVNGRLAHYSIAGGNLEIVRLCSQIESIDIAQALDTATKFRRIEIFEWIIANFKVSYKQFSAALQEAATCDNAICIMSIIDNCRNSLKNNPSIAADKGTTNENILKEELEGAANKALERNHECLGMYLAAKATVYNKNM